MAKKDPVTWKGDAVKAKMTRSSRLAIDATMSAGIIHARGGHGGGARSGGRFESQTGELERGTRIRQPARRVGRRGIVGRWGVIGVAYSRRIELGFQGKDKLGRSFGQPAYPYLAPGASAEYPNLARRIRVAFNA